MRWPGVVNEVLLFNIDLSFAVSSFETVHCSSLPHYSFIVGKGKSWPPLDFFKSELCCDFFAHKNNNHYGPSKKTIMFLTAIAIPQAVSEYTVIDVVLYLYIIQNDASSYKKSCLSTSWMDWFFQICIYFSQSVASIFMCFAN